MELADFFYISHLSHGRSNMIGPDPGENRLNDPERRCYAFSIVDLSCECFQPAHLRVHFADSEQETFFSGGPDAALVRRIFLFQK